MTPFDDQRRVASLLLAAVGRDGFALAGAGAIREHGFTGRPTEDVDLFAFSTVSQEAFAAAVERAERELRTHGYGVVRSRSFPLFVRVHVTDGSGVDMDVDFGVNWRAHAPEVFALGPVLSESDAVAGKLSAVYPEASSATSSTSTPSDDPAATATRSSSPSDGNTTRASTRGCSRRACRS